MQEINLQQTVPGQLSGARFDQVAAELFPDYSRSRLQAWIKSGELTVDGETQRPRTRLVGGETLQINAQLEESQRWQAEAIALDIAYEDDSILVINKPAGLVVHPAAGHADGTLLNALLHHAPQMATLPRAGIVHRLDKETSGLMVVAKSLKAHGHLVEQLQARTMGREYAAVAVGRMTGGGKVDEPIARHPRQRVKMAVSPTGKEAVTHYSIVQHFRAHVQLRLKLETGRTHQIRVHMAHIRHPLVGDPVYGGRLRIPKAATPELTEVLRVFRRQALHAEALQLVHPDRREPMQWQVPAPEDMVRLIAALKADADAHPEPESW